MTWPASQSGFSLVELIVVIVLLGLLAGGGGLLILQPIESYRDQVRRQQLVDQGEMALRQIATDVRRALPNSVRITPLGTGWALELVRTVDGARYRDENETGVVAAGAAEVLDFVGGDTEFNLLGTFSGLTSFAANQRLVIYNTAPATLYQDAASNNNPGIVTPSGATLALAPSGVYMSEDHITINNGATDFRFSQQSPGQRVFVIEEPTSYLCNPATRRIERHTNYGFNPGQSTAPGGSNATVVSQLIGCSMSYAAGSSQRGGILTIEITIGDGSGENVSLLHQVHVENVP